MAESKLARKLLKQFASAADVSEIDVFGSLAASALATSLDPDVIQSLSAWIDGWAAEVVDDQNPVLEDRNAVDYVYSWMMKTVFQMGVPEWLTTETYFIGSYVNSGGTLYKSLANANIGNAVSNPVYWQQIFGGKSLNPQANTALSSRAVATWTNRTDGTGAALAAICWSQVQGLFVAVGAPGSGGDQVLTSADGITWAGETASEANEWNGICYSEELNLYVAVGTLLLTNTHAVMTSPDGATWTNRTASQANLWKAVCWSPELGIFLAVALNGTNRVMTSPDGTTWTNRTIATSAWQSVCWSAELGLFVAVADSAISTSPDGTTWTSRTSTATTWDSVCWSADLGLFVAVSGADGSGKVSTSRDGIIWTDNAGSGSAIAWLAVTWSPELGLFVAVGTSSGGTVGNAMSSRDGFTWTNRTPSQNNQWNAIAWAPQIGIFAATAGAGTNQIMTSKFVKKFIAA